MGADTCCECPVFGTKIVKRPDYCQACEDYLIAAPSCVEDQHYGVFSGTDEQTPKQKAEGLRSSREQAREWGRKIVLQIEGWRGATGTVENSMQEADL